MAQTVEIVPWERRCEAGLESMLLGYLRAQQERRCPILATASNARFLAAMGWAFVAKGDPTLMAVIDARPIGFILWGNTDPPGLESEYRICHTYGSFVEPIVRHAGISDKLRAEGIRRARALGYERIDGQIYTDNARGLKHFEEKYRAKPLAIHYEYEIGGE